MLAKCYLCGNEVDEFAIIETNPEIAICFDCEEKVNMKEIHCICTDEEINKSFIDDVNSVKEILFEGGETHGNKG